MAESNDKKQRKLSHPSLSESISFLRENLKPEIRKISLNKLEKKIKKIDEKRKKSQQIFGKSVLDESPKKFLDRTILEYSFVEQDQGCKLSKSPSVKSFYEKNMCKRMAVEKKIELLKNKKRIESLENLKGPKIDSRSKKLASNRTPLYQRYQQAVAEKTQNIETLRHNLMLQKEDDFGYKRSKSFNRSNFTQWLDNNKCWVQKTAAKVEYLKKTVIEDEAEDHELSFKPKIDSTSDALSKLKRQKSCNVFDKLYHQRSEIESKIKKLKTTLKPSFTPKLNKCPSYVNPYKFYQSKAKTYYFVESENNPLKLSSTEVTSDTKKITAKPKSPKTSINISKNQPELIRKKSDVLYSLNLRNFSAWRPPVNELK